MIKLIQQVLHLKILTWSFFLVLTRIIILDLLWYLLFFHPLINDQVAYLLLRALRVLLWVRFRSSWTRTASSFLSTIELINIQINPSWFSFLLTLLEWSHTLLYQYRMSTLPEFAHYIHSNVNIKHHNALTSRFVIELKKFLHPFICHLNKMFCIHIFLSLLRSLI